MNIEELAARDDFQTMSPIEVGYHLTAEEHQRAYAGGVAWTMSIYRKEQGIDDLMLLWAERANLALIMDDDTPVGFSDLCEGETAVYASE